MNTIGKRISFVRKESGYTQERFADSLNLKRNTIATYELDRSVPSDRTISDICRIFNIEEDWLRHGLEPMRMEKSREEEIAELVGAALVGSNDFKKSVIRMICTRSDAELKVLEDSLRAIWQDIEKNQG